MFSAILLNCAGQVGIWIFPIRSERSVRTRLFTRIGLHLNSNVELFNRIAQKKGTECFNVTGKVALLDSLVCPAINSPLPVVTAENEYTFRDCYNKLAVIRMGGEEKGVEGFGAAAVF